MVGQTTVFAVNTVFLFHPTIILICFPTRRSAVINEDVHKSIENAAHTTRIRITLFISFTSEAIQRLRGIKTCDAVPLLHWERDLSHNACLDYKKVPL